MEKYEIYIEKEGKAFLRSETNNIDNAWRQAYEVEHNNDCEGSVILNTETNEWFGYHKKGSAYVLSR